MYPERVVEGDDGSNPQPVRSSDRLRRIPKVRRQSYYTQTTANFYYRKGNKVRKLRPAAATSQIAPNNVSQNRSTASASVASNLRRSTRKRKASAYLDGYTDSSGPEDEDIMKSGTRSRDQKVRQTKPEPRREGLRSRDSQVVEKIQLNSESPIEQDSSEENVEVGRMSMEEAKQRHRSPRRVLHQVMGTKVSRDVRKSASRVHKRHRLPRADDSDNSLLVDEFDQGPAIPWAHGGNRSGAPWPFGGGGGLDMPVGVTAWGLNAAASGWGHQSDGVATLTTTGIQTAGPSSKGGADIQPLQIDESVSFDDIGGLSQYIDSLKEMVFFPLLYPDFFASYHISPPRGVLLCGPPGTGKTLIARALACSASKAGQKVSFYMRKGADVLSKWVGEAERQLKLLFEEAQRNQPSIIFFDEIDGLAPVRSSKQEQIHNSIVSTLLALMDGLDSRGQVVLIGATNRIDAIDGALRRPGRFDREFNFPLPGYEARAEILDIHTRKWKAPPPKELKLELATSCVGYCGADLKALCTEAAIRAFREKYPQVYTSDDKFLVDVDSVKVEKYHFIEAMSTITPAAHRGSIVHSRPLSLVVKPCLLTHLEKTMNYISDIFPPLTVSSELAKLSRLSYGSAIPLVYRPRLLICGTEGAGLDHLGPAILHELEKFPVHSLGLPSLLADPSAKTPEEALVHIFGEARRTSPSILYVPQFNLWWENAHDQLKAVLLTLLDELPSDSPILFYGTCMIPFSEVEEDPNRIFPHHSVYQVDKPSTENISLFFNQLIEAALSVLSDEFTMSKKSASVPELPKAPKVDNGPKASEIKAMVEAEQHALRRLRMCLRDVCNRLLYDKRFNAFHYPVTDEDAPNYRRVIQNPMDVATLLQRVDSGQYITCSTFVQDVDLIVCNAKAYNGDDYNGARIVSRAFELRDAVHGMLTQMDPALVAYCDKIAAQGGPTQPPDDLRTSLSPSLPVVQLATVTRASARLRNVQPEVNLDQSFEARKKPKKIAETAHAASGSEERLQRQESVPTKPSEELERNGSIPKRQESPALVDSREEHDSSTEASNHKDVTMSDQEISEKVETINKRFVEHTQGYGIPQLERVYTRIMKGVFDARDKRVEDDPKLSILEFLLKFAENKANF
ncbi:hypothetical protein ACFE04_004193 [Oxalis oulophora]